MLAVPGGALAWTIWRFLPEPVRGGQSRLRRGATQMITEDREQLHDARTEVEEPRRMSGAMQRAIAAQGILPRANLVLDVDPAQMSLWLAVRYVLSVPTNVALIVVSALGYFFQSGLRTFAVIFVGYQYSIGQGLAASCSRCSPSARWRASSSRDV